MGSTGLRYDAWQHDICVYRSQELTLLEYDASSNVPVPWLACSGSCAGLALAVMAVMFTDARQVRWCLCAPAFPQASRREVSRCALPWACGAVLLVGGGCRRGGAVDAVWDDHSVFLGAAVGFSMLTSVPPCWRLGRPERKFISALLAAGGYWWWLPGCCLGVLDASCPHGLVCIMHGAVGALMPPGLPSWVGIWGVQ